MAIEKMILGRRIYLDANISMRSQVSPYLKRSFLAVRSQVKLGNDKTSKV